MVEMAVTDGLRYLIGEFSCTQDEWRQHHRGGDMLLEGLVSRGYVLVKGGRFAVSMAGRRRLEAVEGNPLEQDDESQ